MKYFAAFGIILSLFFTTPTSAANDLLITTTATGLTATMQVTAPSTKTVELYLLTTPFPTTPATIKDPVSKTIPAYNVVPQTYSWNITTLSPNTTYYARVLETTTAGVKTYLSNEKTIQTKDVGITEPTLVFTHDTGAHKVFIKGTFDKTKNPLAQQYTVRVQYSQTAIIDQDISLPVYKTHLDTNNDEGVASDGTFHLTISEIAPSTSYTIKQSVTFGKATPQQFTGTFSTDSGYIPATNTAAVQSSFEDRSYRLLSPIPGFTVFMDPDLCAEQIAQGATGQICDINEFINIAFKLLIGAAAVLLVLRIMFEGYKYIVTDIPALKSNAKSGLKDAVLGLLLALSSFIILNTINPKLIENTVSIDGLQIGVTQTSIDPATFYAVTGEKLKTKSEYITLAKTVATREGIADACIVIAVVEQESRGNAAAVGCDENVPSPKVPSRRAFVQSGVTLNGASFPPTTVDAAQKNNCNFDPKKASTGYGLDWRFSKGGGLMQVTVFPTGYNTDAWRASVKKGGTAYNSRTTPFPGWEQIIKPEENLKRGIAILKSGLAQCKNDLECAYRRYQGGTLVKDTSADAKLINDTVAKKMAAYRACKGGN